MWHQHPTGCISGAINDITDYYFKSAYSKFKQRGSQQNIHGYSQTDRQTILKTMQVPLHSFSVMD